LLEVVGWHHLPSTSGAFFMCESAFSALRALRLFIQPLRNQGSMT
jgi:hypothetical protein